MDQIRIKAEERTEQGTAAVRRLRRAGLVPASVMSMNKGGTKLIKFNAHEFMMAMRGRSGKQLLVTLDVQGKEVPALLREMQNDVLAGTPIHVDFSEVSLSQKVRVTVPLRLVGEAVGVKLGGGVLEQVLRSIEVECLPTDIVEEQIASGLDLIVMSRRMADGRRYLSSLSEVSRSADGHVALSCCVEFDETTRSWHLVREPTFVQACLAEGRLTEKEVCQWRQLCA